MRKFLHDPDMNLFIHTTPLRGNYDYYHWHIEIRPHITDFGGFEIGTGRTSIQWIRSRLRIF